MPYLATATASATLRLQPRLVCRCRAHDGATAVRLKRLAKRLACARSLACLARPSPYPYGIRIRLGLGMCADAAQAEPFPLISSTSLRCPPLSCLAVLG